MEGFAETRRLLMDLKIWIYLTRPPYVRNFGRRRSTVDAVKNLAQLSIPSIILPQSSVDQISRFARNWHNLKVAVSQTYLFIHGMDQFANF